MAQRKTGKTVSFRYFRIITILLLVTISLVYVANLSIDRPFFGVASRLLSTQSLINNLWIQASTANSMNSACCLTPVHSEIARRGDSTLPLLTEALQTRPDVHTYRLAFAMCIVDSNCADAVPALLEILANESLMPDVEKVIPPHPYWSTAAKYVGRMDTSTYDYLADDETVKQLLEGTLPTEDRKQLLIEIRLQLPPVEERLACARKRLDSWDRRIVHSAAFYCWVLGYEADVGFDYLRYAEYCL